MIDEVLLDTDVYSEVLRARNPNVVAVASVYRAAHGKFLLSAPTVLETVKGLVQSQRHDEVAALLLALATEEVRPVDREAAIIAGRIYGELERMGQTIGRIDPMIAGVAISSNLTLATGNTRHYQRIVMLGFPLKLANWREPTQAD
jgi:tRNA(fMet)-specific endonuclease VapC